MWTVRWVQGQVRGAGSVPASLVVLSMDTWPGRVPALPVVVAPRLLEPPVVLRRPVVDDRGCAEFVVSPCAASCDTSPHAMQCVVHALQVQ